MRNHTLPVEQDDRDALLRLLEQQQQLLLTMDSAIELTLASMSRCIERLSESGTGSALPPGDLPDWLKNYFGEGGKPWDDDDTNGAAASNN